MNTQLPSQWINNLKTLDIAFQPILNIHTGELFAVEALLRGQQDLGFKSIFDVFDQAFKDGVLYEFDIALREKSFTKFTQIDGFENIKLFYNLDNRLFEIDGKDNEESTKKILQRLNISKDNIFFEISERHEISSQSNMNKVLQHYKNEDYSIAIDDFGVGYSGYKLLYDSTPDIIKVDRFFLKDIAKNIKKKFLVRSITHLAIQLGIKVIAEGVETKDELLTCKEIGCHLIQGFLVQKPTKNTDKILNVYEHIVDILQKDRRKQESNKKMESYIAKVDAININTKMSLVIEYFKKNKDLPIVSIVNNSNEPVGILHESTIKEFLYSPYGISLLANDDTKKTKLKHLMDFCGSADINSNISTIIELFSNNPESSGIIITKRLKYYGFLTARSIINIMNEESLLMARDQNPLTKLPGNNQIEKYISECTKTQYNYVLCYLDLDNFKAYNDVYGFRNGDRVIQLFADTMRKFLPQYIFKAHIGGDDFFLGLKLEKSIDIQNYLFKISTLMEKFELSVKELYSKEDRKNNYITTKDRDDNQKKFPLMSVSAAIVEINEKCKNRSVEHINHVLSSEKKVAKKEIEHISISTLI